MADDTNALEAQQRRAAGFGVVEAFLEVGKGAAGKQVSYLARDRRLQRFFQREAHQIDYAFGNF